MKFTLSKNSAVFTLLMATLTVYLLTLSPTVYLGDSGELSAAAFSLGVPHPSGYPVYALFGKVFCLIPFGSVGFRMNLMAAVFGVLGVWAVYSLIERMTGSKLGAWVGGGVLAFIPVFWWQTVAAEVYTLHVFFVVLMMRVLWEWEERREFFLLVVFALVTGLSFGNHLQTVMLAPGVFYLILSGDRKVLLDGKRFLVLSLFFVLPLLVYLYLPVRTWAGAAIHWGDPDSWDRFWAHVSARSHRGAYVFNLGFWEYVERLKESLRFIWEQFGVMVLVGVWGWWRIRVVRWRVFFVLVVVFDLFYTVFLNTISLEITPFNLSVCVVLAVGIGVGVVDLVRRAEGVAGPGVMRGVKVGCGVVPAMFLVLNFGVSDQSRNYTAYEHALNIFRTTEPDAALLVNGDNNLFPVTYGRLVERMREDVLLCDRQSLLFKEPYLGDSDGVFHGTWSEWRGLLEKEIIEKKFSHGVFYVLFDYLSVRVPERYAVTPYCLLHRVMSKDVLARGYRVPNLWLYYATESLYDNFERDFMNRQIIGHFYLRYGRYLCAAGNRDGGLLHITKASAIAYDEASVHFDAASFLMDVGQFEKARTEIEEAAPYEKNHAVMANLWGLYYFKMGNYEKAVESFREAVEADQEKELYRTNLQLALKKQEEKKQQQ
jgi:hypothetical protein